MHRGLPDLFWGLLQLATRILNPAITNVDILLHVAQILKLETPLYLLLLVGRFELGLQRFAVLPGTYAEVLFCVGKQVMRTSSDKVGLAHLGICDGQLWSSNCGVHKLIAHESLQQLPLLGRHVVMILYQVKALLSVVQYAVRLVGGTVRRLVLSDRGESVACLVHDELGKIALRTAR